MITDAPENTPFLSRVIVTAVLENENVREVVRVTAARLIDMLYRKFHKKVVRYFYQHRKSCPSFKFGWLDARARQSRTEINPKTPPISFLMI